MMLRFCCEDVIRKQNNNNKTHDVSNQIDHVK